MEVVMIEAGWLSAADCNYPGTDQQGGIFFPVSGDFFGYVRILFFYGRECTAGGYLSV